MFKKSAANEAPCSTWILTASQLFPAYDYFDFVNTVIESKERTNLWYSNVMKKALIHAKGEEKLKIAQAINTFNTKNTKRSVFSKDYEQYWSSQEESESQERIAKRQRKVAEESNEVACSVFQAIINKVAAATNSNENNINSSANDSFDCDRVRSSSTNDNSEDSSEKIIEDLEDRTFEELDEKFIFLGKGDFSNSNETISVLLDLTKLPHKPLTNTCKLLLNKLTNCAPSAKVMRDLIRSHALEMEESFDLVLHNDLSFTEVMCTHFLNLIDSPRNPMQQQQLERNTAFLTTIPILHNLFVDCNDIIDMQWIEKQAPLTGDVKWDGVAFLVANKLVTPLFVELSGGIDFNSGTEKERSDEEKLVQQLLKLLKLKKAEGSEAPNQFYIRYHDLHIHFESLVYLGECYIKRSYFELVCPTTPNELKEFVEKIPELYQYREALLDQLKN